MIHSSYLYALGAALCFSGASHFYTSFSRRVSITAVNVTKSVVGLLGCVLACLLIGKFHLPSNVSTACFILSGVIGLGIGDQALFRAFVELGAARTLMIFSFSPVFLGIGSALFLGQTVAVGQIIAIFFLVACSFTMSLEKYRETGSWGANGLIMAFSGVILDNTGVLLSRYAFNLSPEVTSYEANIIRFVGGLAILAVLRARSMKKLGTNYQDLGLRGTSKLAVICFFGTFLSLALYLQAVRTGNIASVSAVSGVCPLFAGFLECVYGRFWPKSYFWISLLFFLLGFGALILFPV